MTLLTTFGILPEYYGDAVAAGELSLSDITIIVPVKNNQAGVTRLISACLEVFSPTNCPAEIILIDNMSSPPLEIPAHLAWNLPVHVLICSRPGAAAARNDGIQQARTKWLLFLDSDCLPTAALINGYQQACNGAIAYAGKVLAERKDTLSHYYDTQGILNPPPLLHNGEERPAYLITANTLILRDALVQIGGFDERFPSAGGEDIDLSLRLWEVGPLSYALAACVFHTFEPHLQTFVRRFVRYGRGNRLLAQRYHVSLAPRPFAPSFYSLTHLLLAWIQFLALWWGYHIVKTTRTEHN